MNDPPVVHLIFLFESENHTWLYYKDVYVFKIRFAENKPVNLSCAIMDDVFLDAASILHRGYKLEESHE